VRLPFPERLPLWPVFFSSVALCVIQQTEGTTLLFSLCSFAFIMIATLAFNVAGGMTRPAGGFIFGYAVLAVIVGLVYKALVGERGQSNLLQPERTLEVFVGGIFSMLVAAYVARRLALKQSLFEKFSHRLDPELGRSATSCLILGGAFISYTYYVAKPPAPGSLLSLLSIFAGFPALALVLGVTAQIRKSGGTRSINLTVILAGSIIFFTGLIGFSKEALFTPVVCWLIAAAAQRYKVSILHIGGLVLFASFSLYYLVPYSQYGRNFNNPANSFRQKVETSAILLSNLGLVRKLFYQTATEVISDSAGNHYYDKPAGLFDRLQMITPDDAIVDLTENGVVFGFLPTIVDIENLVPHLLWRDKPAANFGNIYAHELGILAEDDDSTGISFSPSGDAYHQGKWIGVLVLLPALLVVLFWTSNSIVGDPRKCPVGLVTLVIFSHLAPEGGIGGIIGSSWWGSVQYIAVFFFVTYLLPPTINLLQGPLRHGIDQNVVIAPKHRRPLRVRTVENTVE